MQLLCVFVARGSHGASLVRRVDQPQSPAHQQHTQNTRPTTYRSRSASLSVSLSSTPSVMYLMTVCSLVQSSKRMA